LKKEYLSWKKFFSILDDIKWIFQGQKSFDRTPAVTCNHMNRKNLETCPLKFRGKKKSENHKRKKSFKTEYSIYFSVFDTVKSYCCKFASFTNQLIIQSYCTQKSRESEYFKNSNWASLLFPFLLGIRFENS